MPKTVEIYLHVLINARINDIKKKHIAVDVCHGEKICILINNLQYSETFLVLAHKKYISDNNHGRMYMKI